MIGFVFRWLGLSAGAALLLVMTITTTIAAPASAVLEELLRALGDNPKIQAILDRVPGMNADHLLTLEPAMRGRLLVTDPELSAQVGVALGAEDQRAATNWTKVVDKLRDEGEDFSLDAGCTAAFEPDAAYTDDKCLAHSIQRLLQGLKPPNTP